MLVIVPATIDGSNTTSTAPTSVDPTAWSVSTPYVAGDRVSVYGTVNKIYECLTNVTGGDSPEIDVTKITPKWVETGSTNKFAMFDGLRDTLTVTTTATSFTVTASINYGISALAVLNFSNVTQIQIQFISGPTYNYTSLGDNLLVEYTTSYSNGFIATFTGTAPLSVGALVVGRSVYLGSVQNGSEANFLNFSSIDRDTFGTAYLIPRMGVPKIQVKVFTNKDNVDTLLQLKDDLNAVSTVWSGFDTKTTHPYYKALLIQGFYKEFSFEIDNPIGPMINLEIEETGS